jgi:hypothetical protein
MGGKTALYALAQNIGNIADNVPLVVTINSPINSLQDYYYVGGEPAVNYWAAEQLLWDQGVIDSVAYYDSSQDGAWVGLNRHWLAFISGEAAPLSKQSDVGGVDPLPRDMDDSIVPISAQYSHGADVIYYGEYGHSDFAVLPEVAEFLADQILRYLFGGNIEFSVFARGGTFVHKADFFLGTDYWEDLVGEVLASSGSVRHQNESYVKWQEWEDVVGECSPESSRGGYQASRVTYLPLLTSIEELRWVSAANLDDCRIYLRTRVAPRNSLQVDWSIYQRGLLPLGIRRDHYEVEIVTGFPLTSVRRVSWETDDSSDLRLRIYSEAESPFRWFKVEWRVYFKESQQRRVIDEIPGQEWSETVPIS